ncbi:hypothetical protein DY000_02059228 [Brassica cretica]|uniref:Uncharacterized protein n=1 Tax=Brassica cretica TaxID=69181 RepID=A0ABQ7ANW7_BRACR|nr:hypothetical protein DY000_02059228 [Brassica cretica]
MISSMNLYPDLQSSRSVFSPTQLKRTLVLETVFVYRNSNEVECTGLEKEMMRRKMKAWKKKGSDSERCGSFTGGEFGEVIGVV